MVGRVGAVGIAGRGIESRRGGAIFSAHVRTGLVARPATCTVGTGRHAEALTTHLSFFNIYIYLYIYWKLLSFFLDHISVFRKCNVY